VTRPPDRPVMRRFGIVAGVLLRTAALFQFAQSEVS
jgi:hypothetical protein